MDKVPLVSLELSGKWIAWDELHTHVVASGASLADVHEEVEKKGEKNVWFDKVPSRTDFFGGAAFHK
ncbi:MAG: hypothetical protein A3E36_00220 [Candidatus Andersenbacteria bacterium RIFCSPHIGHO2_12_FULL_45_11b]|uniref:DUF5678 domain-containing protein n=1 Tax=Candidatus Andersenbacteria bacterium RIFCSPHIGHO2_12_FULL_45_11b TaxID=1797282 RepID=A0A1G1X7H6_9BACT|nr:MAG: hypothetical protein A3E36_00220 [Candidatus Andersenbacteria bacterium RIFCSPHIGHO2_12_FULL_45_11b]